MFNTYEEFVAGVYAGDKEAKNCRDVGKSVKY